MQLDELPGRLVTHAGYHGYGIIVGYRKERLHLSDTSKDYLLAVMFDGDIYEDWWHQFAFVNPHQSIYNLNTNSTKE